MRFWLLRLLLKPEEKMVMNSWYHFFGKQKEYNVLGADVSLREGLGLQNVPMLARRSR